MFLLDTNVVSELRKPRPHGAVLAWFSSVPRTDIAIPAVVIAELQTGAELSRRQDTAKALEIERWIDHIMLTIRIVPMDGTIFREWARVMDGKPDELFEDAMIVATARIHRLIVVSRNVKDFEQFDVDIFNPFLSQQAEPRRPD